MGSRYGGLKQLDPMGPNGEVVLDYSVYDAIRAGFGKVVFIIRRDFEDIFKEKVGSRFAGKIEVDKASPCRKAGKSPGAPPTPCVPPATW